MILFFCITFCLTHAGLAPPAEMTLNQGTVIGRRFENLGFESYKAEL